MPYNLSIVIRLSILSSIQCMYLIVRLLELMPCLRSSEINVKPENKYSNAANKNNHCIRYLHVS